MILIPKNQTESTIYVPKNSHSADKSLTLSIKSLSTLKIEEYEVTDRSLVRDFYEITFNHSLQEGEYECKLIGDDTKESFLIRVGSYVEKRQTENKVYNNEVTYIQYNG